MAMNLAMIWSQDISRFKMKSDKKERKGESETLRCGAVSPDLVARDFLAAESGPGSTLGEQVTSPTFYKIKTLASMVVKIIIPAAASDKR